MPRFYFHLPTIWSYFLLLAHFMELVLLVVSDPLHSGTLYKQSSLLYPLVILIISLLYSFCFRFSLWWLIGNGLLFALLS